MTFAAFINSDERDADLRSLSSITMHGDNPYGEPDRKISVFLCLLLMSLNITLPAKFYQNTICLLSQNFATACPNRQTGSNKRHTSLEKMINHGWYWNSKVQLFSRRKVSALIRLGGRISARPFYFPLPELAMCRTYKWSFYNEFPDIIDTEQN